MGFKVSALGFRVWALGFRGLRRGIQHGSLLVTVASQLKY